MISMNVHESLILPSFPEGKILVKQHYNQMTEKMQQAGWQHRLGHRRVNVSDLKSAVWAPQLLATCDCDSPVWNCSMSYSPPTQTVMLDSCYTTSSCELTIPHSIQPTPSWRMDKGHVPTKLHVLPSVYCPPKRQRQLTDNCDYSWPLNASLETTACFTSRKTTFKNWICFLKVSVHLNWNLTHCVGKHYDSQSEGKSLSPFYLQQLPCPKFLVQTILCPSCKA